MILMWNSSKPNRSRITGGSEVWISTNRDTRKKVLEVTKRSTANNFGIVIGATTTKRGMELSATINHSFWYSFVYFLIIEFEGTPLSE
jgi:hypothetical protein